MYKSTIYESVDQSIYSTGSPNRFIQNPKYSGYDQINILRGKQQPLRNKMVKLNDDLNISVTQSKSNWNIISSSRYRKHELQVTSAEEKKDTSLSAMNKVGLSLSQGMNTTTEPENTTSSGTLESQREALEPKKDSQIATVCASLEIPKDHYR